MKKAELEKKVDALEMELARIKKEVESWNKVARNRLNEDPADSYCNGAKNMAENILGSITGGAQ